MNERLERLEQELTATRRRLGQVQIAFALAVVAGLCIGWVRPAVTQGKDTTVKAPFTVVDDDGRPVLEITARKHGGGLTVFNQAGKGVAAMAAVADGGGLFVDNNNVESDGPVASLEATKWGGRLLIYQNNGDPVAGVIVDRGGGKLLLFDRREKLLFEAP